MSNESQRRWAMLILAAVAICAAMKFSQPVMAPLALGFITSVLLTPVRDRWARLGLGQTPAAVMAFFTAIILVVLAAFLLRPSVQSAIAEWPSMKAELMSSLSSLRQSFREFYNLQEQLSEAFDPAASSSGGAGVSFPGLADAAFLAPQVMGQFLIFLGAVFFFLLNRQDFYRWLAKFLNSNTTDAGWGEATFLVADRDVNAYFTAVTAINIGFGALVSLSLMLIGLPGAVIWGVVAALTNFVVYLGAVVTAGLLLLAGMVTFDGWMVAVPAAVFMGLNFIEGQFVTPSVVGRKMDINPLLVFVAMTFAIWLWGAIGGIVAIPLVVWFIALIHAEAEDERIRREKKEAAEQAAAEKAEAKAAAAEAAAQA